MPRNAWIGLPRNFVDKPLGLAQTVALVGNQRHYLLHVRRLRSGDEVLLFNGRDGEWLAALEETSATSILAVCRRQIRPQQNAPHLPLIFAPIKRGYQEYMIEKACELGVSDFYPVATDHSHVRQLNLGRLGLISAEAAEQSERLDIPVFHAPGKLMDTVTHVIERGSQIIACVEKGQADPLLTAIQKIKSETMNIGVLVGPEGGFSDSEIEMLHNVQQIRSTSLGQRILRADTTAIAALSCLSCLRMV